MTKLWPSFIKKYDQIMAKSYKKLWLNYGQILGVLLFFRLSIMKNSQNLSLHSFRPQICYFAFLRDFLVGIYRCVAYMYESKV